MAKTRLARPPCTTASDLACWAGRAREVTKEAMGEIQERIQRHIDTLTGTGAETGVQSSACTASPRRLCGTC